MKEDFDVAHFRIGELFLHGGVPGYFVCGVGSGGSSGAKAPRQRAWLCDWSIMGVVGCDLKSNLSRWRLQLTCGW